MKGKGFSGHRPRLSSSSGAFAKRGDPWVTDREGQKDYDRLVEIENPDMDADRQRHNRFSKELQDRLKKPIDFKSTMAEAIETERSTRMDSYHQRDGDKLFPRKPKSGEWPKAGKDFEVATIQRRCVSIAMRVKREIQALEGKNTTGIVSGGKATGLSARIADNERIPCPRGCGLTATDSRTISRHLHKFKNSCCTHLHCNCVDCKAARNE